MRRIILGLLIVAVSMVCSSAHGQEKPFSFQKDSIMPLSVYQTSFLKSSTFSPFSLKNQFSKTRLEFTFLNALDIVEENYQIPLSIKGGPPTKFIYDTYKDIYHRMDLQKSFFKVSELYDLPRPKKF